MNFKSKVYVFGVSLIGIAAIAGCFWQWESRDLWRFLCYMLVATLAAGLKVNLPRFPGTMSVGFLFVFVGITEPGLAETSYRLRGHPDPCLWKPKRRPALYQIVFSLASTGLAILMAYSFHHAPAVHRFDRNAMMTLRRNTIFTNVALTADGGVWWEGMTDEPPAECTDWRGERWTPEIQKQTGAKAAHPNGRFPAPASQCPSIDAWKIRRACRSERSSAAGGGLGPMPLVYQAFNWSAGVSRGRHDGLGDNSSGERRGGRGETRSHGDAAIYAVITWATTSATGSGCNDRSARRRGSST